MQTDTALSPVFVGRAGELDELTGALARATAGEPQALLVGGEAGVGKTRLLEEFLSRAREAGAVTAVGGCLELGADGLPFAPFATALRSLHRQLGHDALTTAAAGREPELARLLPDLAPADGPRERDSRVLYDEVDERARLFEVTAQLLERCAASRTVVLALEDVHWADRSTRELLGYLYRSLQSARLVVLATYRADDIHRRHPLRPFLAELDRLRTVRRIDLPRLTHDQVRQQIAGIQGVAEPRQDLVRTIFERSEGNPFFVEELTHHCATCTLHESLRDLLLVRVEALPEDTQETVRTVAVGGSRVEHALLAAVAALPEDELTAVLRAAVGANILVPTPDGDAYTFRHALLREAVLDDLLPGELPRLSRRYAAALEADPRLVAPEARSTRLAHYWCVGRDAAKALPAKLDAAREARARHAFAEQHQMLEQAIELWGEVPEEARAGLRPIDHAEVYPSCAGDSAPLRFMDLLAEAVVAGRTGGEAERALSLTKRALKLVDERREPLRAAWFLMKRSRLVEDLGRGDGWEEIGRAQELVRGLPPSAVHAEILAGVAGWSMIHQPGPEALSTAERAVELARLVGATVTELQARVTLGILMVDAGRHEAGLAELSRAADQAEQAGDPAVMLRAQINTGAVLESIGRSREAAWTSRRAAENAERHGRTNMVAFALGNEAVSWLALGDWRRCRALGERARELARASDAQAGAAYVLGELGRLQGRWDAVERALAENPYRGRESAEPRTHIPMRLFAHSLAAARGDLAAARAETLPALDAGFPVGSHEYAWRLLLAVTATESAFLGLPAARAGRDDLLDRVAAAARRLTQPAPVWEAYAASVAAELTRARGASDAARWAEAAAAWEALERPYDLAAARHRLAEALVADGSREEAAVLLRQAHATACELGAAPLREETEQLAARARLPLGDEPPVRAPEPADPAASFGLTRRERDVLTLVAAGRSNRAIAEELFIAPKTASVHVSNILAKLNVPTRGEAAALAHRLHLVPVAEVG